MLSYGVVLRAVEQGLVRIFGPTTRRLGNREYIEIENVADGVWTRRYVLRTAVVQLPDYHPAVEKAAHDDRIAGRR